MAYGRQICYEAQSSLRSTNDLGVEDGRQGRTSIAHTLTKAADVLLEAWRFHYACEHDLEVDSLVVNWCRIKRFLGIRCLDAGARKRFGPSVFAVVGEIHARQSQHRTDCNARFIGGRQPICGFPGDESTSTRACSRETTGAWPNHLPFQHFSKLPMREASQQHFVIALRGKRRLRTTLRPTLDCCRLLFLGRRPLPLESSRGKDP